MSKKYTRLTLLAESGASFEDLLLLSGHATPKRCLRYFEMARSGIAKKRLEELRRILGTGREFLTG